MYVACIFKGNMATDYVHTQLSGWWMSQRSNKKLWLWCRQCLAIALSDAGYQGNGRKDIINITKVCEYVWLSVYLYMFVIERDKWSLTVGWPMSNSRMFSWPSTILSSVVLGLPENKKGAHAQSRKAEDLMNIKASS